MKYFWQPASFWIVCTVLTLASLIAVAGTGVSRIAPAVSVPVIPTNTVTLADFGKCDGKTLNTEAFARAISTLSEKGGGELVVPPGIWLTGPIKLRSNINLHVE